MGVVKGREWVSVLTLICVVVCTSIARGEVLPNEKPKKLQVFWCDFYFKGGGMQGYYFSPPTKVILSLNGFEAGQNCTYSFRGKFLFSFGAGIYRGDLSVTYENETFQGKLSSSSFIPTGTLRLMFPLSSRVMLGLYSEIKQSLENRFNIAGMLFKVNEVALEFTNYSQRHLDIELRILRLVEAGITLRVDSRYGLSPSLGVAWKRYTIGVGVVFDTKSEMLLVALHTEVAKRKQYDFELDSLLVVPGLTWCTLIEVCIGFEVPFAFLDNNSWMWGVEGTLTYRPKLWVW